MFIEFVQVFLGIASESCIIAEYVFAGISFLIMLVSFVGVFWFVVLNLLRGFR